MHSIRNTFNIKHAVLAVAAAGLLLSALVTPINSAYAQESINDVDVTDREELMDLLNSLLERVAELRAQLDEQRGSSSGDDFEIGDEVITTSRLSVREEPAGVRLAVAEAGDTATIIDGPVQLDGYTWWKLKFSYGTPTMTNLTGWSASAWLVSEDEADDDENSSHCEIAKFATVEAWEAACGDEENDDEIIARVIISDMTTEGDGVHGDDIMLGDGTVIGNGDWFAITDDGTYVDDDTTVIELDDIEDFEGLAVVRDGIGGITIGHVGMNASESDRESTEGRIVFENGSLIEGSIDTVDFENHSNYNDEYGTDFDYTDLRSATRLAFGTLVATGRDEVVMRVQFGGDDSDEDDLMDDEANDDDDDDDEVVEGDWDVWDIREVYYHKMATEFLQISEDVDSNGEEIDVNKDYIVYYIYLEDTDTEFERLAPQINSDIKVIACTSCDDEEFYDAFYAEGMGGTEESIEYLKDLAEPMPSPNEAAGCDGNEVWSAQIGWCVEGAGSGGSQR